MSTSNEVELNVKVNPYYLKSAADILDKLGITMDTAIDLFLRQVDCHNGYPFEITLPEIKNVSDGSFTEDDLDATLDSAIEIINRSYREWKKIWLEIDGKEIILKDIFKSRYSVRSFDTKNFNYKGRDEALAIGSILSAGQLAPTAKNLQPQRIFVACSKEARAKLESVCECIYGAPVIFVICYSKNEVWKSDLGDGRNSGDIDCSIVATHMMLMAEVMGGGTCWVERFNPDEVKRVLELDDDLVVSSLLLYGPPADDAKPSPRHSQRKSTSETVKYI